MSIKRKKKKQILFLTLYLWSALSTYVFAQEAKPLESAVNTKPKSQLLDPELQQVEVKGVSDNPKNYATTKTIISNEQLNRYGDSNIIDAMKRAPGVLVGDDSLSLPGLSASYTKILIDGEPRLGTPLKNLPLVLVDRVEILRLGSAEFSSQAIGGIINIVLKKKIDSKQGIFKVQMSAREWVDYDVSWYNSNKSENLTYSTTLTANREPYISSKSTIEKITELNSIDGQIRKYSSTDKIKGDSYFVNFTPRIQFKKNNVTNYTVVASISNRTNNIERDYSVFNVSETDTGSSQQKISSANEFVAANVDLKIKTIVFQDVKIDLNLASNYSVRDGNYNIFNLVDLSSEKHSKYDSSAKQFGLSNSGKLTMPIKGEHSIVGGWSFSRKSSDFKRNDINDGATNVAHKTHNSSSVDSGAIFVQDEWDINKHSSVYVGFRWESLHIQNTLDGQKNLSNRFSILSPVIQSVWKLNTEEENRLRFGVSRAYKPPTEAQLVAPKTKVFVNSIFVPQMLSNSNLSPELAWSLSAAYEHQGKDDLNYNLRYTLRNIKDTHQTNISYSDNTWFSSTVNSGNAQSKLLEFDVTFPLKRFYVHAPNIDLSFYAFRNWTKISSLPKPDNLLTPIAWNVNFNLEYKAKNLPMNIGTGFSRNSNNWIQLSSNSRQFQSQHPNVDAYVVWRFDKKTKLRASISNLLKRQILREAEFISEKTKTLSQSSAPGYRWLQFNLEHSF